MVHIPLSFLSTLQLFREEIHLHDLNAMHVTLHNYMYMYIYTRTHTVSEILDIHVHV